MTPQFHSLSVAQVLQETPDAISILFDVPHQLAPDYSFNQGQHLTLKATVAGQEVRRSYSICSGVQEGQLKVAVKKVNGGVFSTWLHDQLKAGQTLEVMTPEGHFFTPLNADQQKHYVAFVAGSGITPILSIIKTTLATEPKSQFTLVYGNRRQSVALFQEELEDLKNTYLTRLRLINIFSREAQEAELLNGRLDGAKVQQFLQTLIPAASINEAFICGPNSMIDEVEATLQAAGVNKANIHTERFGVVQEGRPAVSHAEDAPEATITVIADGNTRQVDYHKGAESILDVALASGMNLPYSCKGGVCNTCRCKVLEGKVRMDRNFALEQHDVDQGFVLSCQAHPLTEKVVISFDNR